MFLDRITLKIAIGLIWLFVNCGDSSASISSFRKSIEREETTQGQFVSQSNWKFLAAKIASSRSDASDAVAIAVEESKWRQPCDNGGFSGLQQNAFGLGSGSSPPVVLAAEFELMNLDLASPICLIDFLHIPPRPIRSMLKIPISG